jgi:lipoprotein-anchoring transpeptidase ErfK/SrfK
LSWFPLRAWLKPTLSTEVRCEPAGRFSSAFQIASLLWSRTEEFSAPSSPTGKFEIVNRLANPTYYHAGVVIPAGKNNPLGPRWVGLNKQGYGIHGTSAPGSIGKAASHGCIRMRNRDVVEFATLVSVGDTVEIRGERDEEIARIFGIDSGTVVAAAQTIQATSVAVSGQ